MKIVCVYKIGGDYDIRYVDALRYATDRFINTNHVFQVITDVPQQFVNRKGLEVIPMRFNWKGWWSKLELFRPEINDENDMSIYFDLDVLIKKSLKDFIRVCVDSPRPVMLRSADQVGIKNDWPSSSIMSWKGKDMSRVWFSFISAPEKHIERVSHNTPRAGQRTDQGFIREIMTPLFFQDILSDDYIAFKSQYLRDPGLYERCHILNWTGRPRFHKMDDEHWPIKSLWQIRHEQYGKKLNKLTNQML